MTTSWSTEQRGNIEHHIRMACMDDEAGAQYLMDILGLE